jgi:type IV secretion system protein VirB10
MQGAAGLAADVDNHFWKMFGSSLLVGGASLLLPKSQQNITVNVGSTGDTQSGGAIVATTLAQVTQTMMERNRVIAPTLTVAEGSPFLFIVTQDMALTPYRGNP